MAFSLLACSPLLTFSCAREAPPQDVLLISIDTLRADHLSVYGYPRATSPAIDAFARDALVFENCFSHASDTRLAFSALMSGFHPHETAVMKSGSPGVDDGLLSLAFQHQGYLTAAIVSNYVLRGARGWDLGFDVYDDTMEEKEAVRPLPERTAVATTDRAIEVLRAEREQPLFLWVHYQDPHGPYSPPEQHALFGDSGVAPRAVPLNVGSLSGDGGIPSYQVLDGETDFHDYVARYDGEIHFADSQVGRLFEEMKRLGTYDSSVIIFTSDHGEGMGERDYYFAHGEEVRAPLLRVPLILKLGSRLTGRRANPVQHIDIVPTLHQLLAFEKDPRWRGQDLLAASRQAVDRYAIVNSPVAQPHHKLSIERDGFQLVHSPEIGRDELFDLRQDPNALEDLSADSQHTQRVHEMRARLLDLREEDRLALENVDERPELTEEELEKLRALGYVQ